MVQTHKPDWEIDKTHPDYIEDLVIGLSAILDPDLGYSILELGLVRDISLTDDKANVRMILTTPFCPYGPAMLEETRAKVAGILQKPTTIEYGSEAWKPEMMDPELRDDDWGLMGF
jgi:metal-sulfur cluster biosynthetic enzyme